MPADHRPERSGPGTTSDTTVAVTAAGSGARSPAGTFGPYRIVKELGKGGMGAVYAAIDTRLDRPLALKVMLPECAADPHAKERFLREARAAAKVAHDNVVTVYEADVRDGVPYIAMQFLEGCPLDRYLKQKGNPTVPQVLRVAAETAAGLAAAHKIGLVHRDIKPGNLWLEAPHGRVKVLDFGLAKPADAETELTKSGVIVGTPAYMSPEQARGERVGPRSDLFSLGAVLYRLCTGRVPFGGPTTMAVLTALGTAEPVPVRELNPDVPEPLAELIHQLLAKNPAARPPGAAEVARRARAIAEDLVAPHPRPPDLSASQPQTVRPQVVYAVMPVTVVPEANPFADLDSPNTEPDTLAPPARARRGARWPWAAGGAGLAALVAAGALVIKNKIDAEPKPAPPPEPPAKDRDRKPPPPPPPAPLPFPSHPNQRAAEWVLARGGAVRLTGEVFDRTAADGLPKGDFVLDRVLLNGRSGPLDLAELRAAKDLTLLELSGTPLSEAGFETVKGFAHLVHLNIDGTGATNAGLAHLAGLTNLATLYLSSDQVTDDGLRHLKGLTKLTFLRLRCKCVSDPGLAHLQHLSGLTYLDLRGTPVKPDGIGKFRAAVGACRIEFDGPPEPNK